MTIYTVDWPSFLKKKEVIYHYNFYFIHEFIARGGKHWRFIKFASSRLIQFRKGRQRGKQRRAVERRRVLEDKRRERRVFGADKWFQGKELKGCWFDLNRSLSLSICC